MATNLTIGELAEAAGVPTSTVRYYERTGILKPGGRSPGNYRVYSESELERLRFIRAAQATGFTLGDIKALLRPAGCTKVQGVIQERLCSRRRSWRFSTRARRTPFKRRWISGTDADIRLSTSPGRKKFRASSKM